MQQGCVLGFDVSASFLPLEQPALLAQPKMLSTGRMLGGCRVCCGDRGSWWCWGGRDTMVTVTLGSC